MNKNIPTYQLNTVSKYDDNASEVFFLNHRIEKPKVEINIPHRSNFYAIGICLRGKAEIKINLDKYIIEHNSLIIKPTHLIREWISMSNDFESLTIFFTKDFIINNNNLNIDKFPFFEAVAKHVFELSTKQSENMIESLNFLLNKYKTANMFRNEILKNNINSFLYEVSSIYDEQNVLSNSMQNRSQFITSEFKSLVNIHFSKERSLKFYSEKLFITSKHLTETVKEVTGKTAGEWIKEMVVLEAKFLLQNPSLNISQISNILNFVDQSTFGKFFKKSTGFSPVSYKKSF